MIVANVVLPRPGGPNNNTWSRASPRDFAAARAMPSCSLAFSWPMNSPSHLGRSFNSNDLSSSTRSAETSRSDSLLPADIGIRLAAREQVSERRLNTVRGKGSIPSLVEGCRQHARVDSLESVHLCFQQQGSKGFESYASSQLCWLPRLPALPSSIFPFPCRTPGRRNSM